MYIFNFCSHHELFFLSFFFLVQERRISRRKSFLDKQKKEQDAIEKVKSERIRMKKTATDMFTSEGVESISFSYE